MLISSAFALALTFETKCIDTVSLVGGQGNSPPSFNFKGGEGDRSTKVNSQVIKQQSPSRWFQRVGSCGRGRHRRQLRRRRNIYYATELTAKSTCVQKCARRSTNHPADRPPPPPSPRPLRKPSPPAHPLWKKTLNRCDCIGATVLRNQLDGAGRSETITACGAVHGNQIVTIKS